MRFAGEAFEQRRRQPRFADAGLAGEQHHLAFAALRLGPAPQQQFEFFFPPDERGQAARVQRLEAAFRRTRPQRRPGPRRPGDALEVLGPEVLQLEQIAEQPARALGDDDHVRFGDRLQARREVRRLADDAALLRLPRSDQVADDDQPGRDPDPHVQGRAGRGDEFRRGLDDGEPGLHGALGVVFVGLRIAEIGEHAVAHVFGDEAAVALDQLRAAAMIGADDLAHVLGIEPRRHRGRADEIAEHHGELAALGGVCRRRRCRYGAAARLRIGRAAVEAGKFRDRLEQLARWPRATTPSSFEVVRRQLRQNLAVDFVLAKRGLVLPETEASQPIPDVHRRTQSAGEHDHRN